jgi:hypothetical protein
MILGIMTKLDLKTTTEIIGGFDCDRIGARLQKLYEKGRDYSRNARRYYELGCVG